MMFLNCLFSWRFEQTEVFVSLWIVEYIQMFDTELILWRAMESLQIILAKTLHRMHIKKSWYKSFDILRSYFNLYQDVHGLYINVIHSIYLQLKARQATTNLCSVRSFTISFVKYERVSG